MLRQENAVAAQRVVRSLRATLTTSAESLEDLKRSFDHRPPGSLSEAKTFCDGVGKELDQLQADVAPIQALMKAPLACDLLDAGEGLVAVVDRVVGLFQARLKEAYGIEVEVADELADVPPPTAVRVEELSSPTVARTPARGTPPEEGMPATPKLEDFGISRAELAALAEPREGYEGGVEIGSGDYVEAVARSMDELGIETPVQVADKFSARRHIALRGVMQGTTPRMRAEGRTLDFTALAGGYYKRELDFGEEGLRERYEAVGGFWKEKVGFEDLERGLEVVKEGGGVEEEVVERLERLLGVDGTAVLAGLTKIKVLSVEMGEGGTVYRYRG